MMERDLVPLLDLGSKKAFIVDSEQTYFEECQTRIMNILDIALEKPSQIIQRF